MSRCHTQCQRQPDDARKNICLNMLQDTNEVLFYRLMSEHMYEMLPVIYDPTVAIAIETYNLEYRWPRGVYLSIDHPEAIEEAFRNFGAEADDIDLLVATDVAAGGTAVGTGLNTQEGFGPKIAAEIAQLTGHPFVTAPNKFAAQGSLDAMVNAHASLRGVAVALMKIANDLRWLGSGPRAGIHELNLPANEPGSSIMSGKVNPTQEEAMVMVCIQVLDDDTAVAFAGSQGNFELNAMRPIIINNVLHSARILGDASEKLRVFSIEGITLEKEKINAYVNESLMLATALSPVIGYDKASPIAHKALDENITLQKAAVASGDITADEFDKIVVPANMVGNPHKDLEETRKAIGY